MYSTCLDISIMIVSLSIQKKPPDESDRKLRTICVNSGYIDHKAYFTAFRPLPESVQLLSYTDTHKEVLTPRNIHQMFRLPLYKIIHKSQSNFAHKLIFKIKKKPPDESDWK